MLLLTLAQVRMLLRFPPMPGAVQWNVAGAVAVGDPHPKLFRGPEAAWRQLEMLQLLIKLGYGRSRAAITTLIGNKDHGLGYKEMLEHAFNPALPEGVRSKYLHLVNTFYVDRAPETKATGPSRMI